MNLPRKTKPTILVIAVAAIAVGGFVAYEHQQNSLQHRLLHPKKVDVNNLEVKKFTSSKPTIVHDSSLPAGTITPSQLNEKPKDYAGKEVKVRGMIIAVEDHYAITDQQSKKPVAFVLESKDPSINFKKYVPATRPGETTVIKPVTIIGTFNLSPPPAPSGQSQKVASPVSITVTAVES